VSSAGTTYKGTLATLEEFRAWIAGCDIVIAGRVRTREAFLRRDEVEKFIDRIDAASATGTAGPCNAHGSPEAWRASCGRWRMLRPT